MPDHRPSTVWLLRACCALLLAGHGWLCLHGHMPLRALLWDEQLVAGWVKRIAGMEWGEWASSLDVDDGITAAIRVQGWIFLGFAVAALVPLRHIAFRSIYLLAAADLIFLAWLKFHDTGMAVAQFYEHASQFLLPLVLFLAVAGRRWIAIALTGLAATYIGHGLYALGWTSETMWLNHPRPGDYSEMTMICLGISNEVHVERILTAAGVIDLVAAGLLFVPGWARRISLAYMVVWGFLTALARPWSKYDPHAAYESLSRWLPELFYRAPHYLLPLCILLALRPRKAEG